MSKDRKQRFPYTNDVNIGVWDCTFYLTDDDGNEVLNEDGTIKMFDAPNLDWSYIAEYVELDDLAEKHGD